MTERKDSLQADLPSKEAEPANYPAAGQPINNLQPITMTQPSQPSQQPPGLVAANRTPGIHPALAALNPSFRPLMGQQAPLSVTHPPPAGVTSGVGQSAQRPLGLHPSFFLPGLAQQLAGVVPIRPKIQPKVQTRPGGASSSSNKKQCNCKNSRCLKLYCECFASGKYCDGCNCKDCCNNKAHEDVRQAAVEAVLDRNPNAFRPKIAGQVEDTAAVAAPKHNKGCNCKKSGCLKKYCECFQAGITCSDNCRCVDCKNFEGSASRAVVLSQHPKSKAYSYPPLPRIPPTSALATTKLEDVPATGMTQSQRQLAAKEVLRDVMQPEVVEKLASLLMVVSAEEAERHPFIGPGPSETSVSAGAPRSKLYEEQERLVLTEFRDALRTITRVVADKVEKKASVIAAKQNAIAAALAAQQAQAQAQAQARPAQVQVRNTQLQIPHGMQAVYALRNGQPQMVLVPQALLAQHQQMQQNLPRSLTPQQLQVAGISQQPAGAPTLSGVPAQPQLGQSAPTPELDQTKAKAQQPSQVIN